MKQQSLESDSVEKFRKKIRKEQFLDEMEGLSHGKNLVSL